MQIPLLYHRNVNLRYSVLPLTFLLEVHGLRKTNQQVRSLKGARLLRSDTRARNASIGDSLRRAKLNLFIRRFVLLLVFLLLAVAVIYLILGGYIEKAYLKVLDYLV